MTTLGSPEAADQTAEQPKRGAPTAAKRKKKENASPIGGHHDPRVPRRVGVDHVTRRWSRLPAVVGGGPRSGREERRREIANKQGGGGSRCPFPPFSLFIYLFFIYINNNNNNNRNIKIIIIFFNL